MILGRTSALWLALVTASLNVAVSVFSIGFTTDQLAVLNAFAVALIGVIANEQNPTSAGTFALTTKAPADGSGGG